MLSLHYSTVLFGTLQKRGRGGEEGKHKGEGEGGKRPDSGKRIESLA